MIFFLARSVGNFVCVNFLQFSRKERNVYCIRATQTFTVFTGFHSTTLPSLFPLNVSLFLPCDIYVFGSRLRDVIITFRVRYQRSFVGKTSKAKINIFLFLFTFLLFSFTRKTFLSVGGCVCNSR